MSQSPTNQIVSVTAVNTAFTVSAPQYYERIIITNESSADLYVSTNGSPASTSAGGFGAVVVPGAWRMIGNDQPRQPLVMQAEAAPSRTPATRTPTTPNLNALASGHPAVVSMLFPVGSTPGAVALEFV